MKGQALLLVFLLLLIVGILVSALASMWQAEIRVRSLEKEGLGAFYLAQAGIERAKIELKTDWDWIGMDTNNDDVADNSEKESMGGGYYWVDIVARDDSDPAHRRATSEAHGWINGSHRAIRIELEKEETNPGPPPTYDYHPIPWSWREK
ncbi:MAG: hypothetical protein ABIH40_05845 [Candidatus Omnitrophota bacterium]